MTNSTNNVSKSQISDKNVYRADIYEAEINLIDDFKVFWKRKYFIILVSLSVGISCWYRFFLSPKDYKTTYVYNVSGVMRIVGI